MKISKIADHSILKPRRLVNGIDNIDDDGRETCNELDVARPHEKNED